MNNNELIFLVDIFICLSPSPLLGPMGDGAASSGLGVLSPNPDAPPVPESPVGPDLLHPLDVIAELGVEALGEDLHVLARLEVLLPVEEPEGDHELLRVLDDADELLDLVSGKLSSALVDVDLGLLADEVGEAAAKALDLRQSEDHIPLTLNVSVEDTEDVLELLSLHKVRHDCGRGSWDRGWEMVGWWGERGEGGRRLSVSVGCARAQRENHW